MLRNAEGIQFSSGGKGCSGIPSLSPALSFSLLSSSSSELESEVKEEELDCSDFGEEGDGGDEIVRDVVKLVGEEIVKSTRS
jgi:hypothetical protein